MQSKRSLLQRGERLLAGADGGHLDVVAGADELDDAQPLASSSSTTSSRRTGRSRNAPAPANVARERVGLGGPLEEAGRAGAQRGDAARSAAPTT